MGAGAGAESYIVEWNRQKDGRWVSETDDSVFIIVTDDTTVPFKANTPGRIRWRVYGVPRVGESGARSHWRELNAP